MRIVKKLPSKRDQIRLSCAEYLLRVAGFSNQSDRNRFDTGFPSDALRVCDMVARYARHDFCVDRPRYSTRDSTIVSSMAQWPPGPSVAEHRKNKGLSCGHTALTVSVTSRANRMRPFRSPP